MTTTTIPTLSEILKLTGPGLTGPVIYVTLAYSPAETQVATLAVLRGAFPEVKLTRGGSVMDHVEFKIAAADGVAVHVLFRLEHIAESVERTETVTRYVVDGEVI